jgi:hypothetical protein
MSIGTRAAFEGISFAGVSGCAGGIDMTPEEGSFQHAVFRDMDTRVVIIHKVDRVYATLLVTALQADNPVNNQPQIVHYNSDLKSYSFLR